MPKRRIPLWDLLGLSAVIAFVGVPSGLVYRQVQHEKANTALIAAVKNNDTAGVMAALNRGADINAKDMNGRTALEQAVVAENVEGVRILLERHANLIIPTSEGTSILSEAIRLRGDAPEEPALRQIVALLKKAGAKEERGQGRP
ncbi:MAG TPA: ankyrin repeat domain-containing protein [Chthonomonadaceae bacterium]|nr:ankyrin repeat domain-containing protein [Chthonomonadaceae bacterium]